MATQNFAAALRMTMPNVVQKYLRHFELQQRVQTLRNVSRVRRLPNWVPSKSLLLRFMTRNSLSWARRSAIIHNPAEGRADLKLVQTNGNGRRGMIGARSSAEGHQITFRTGTDGFDGSSGRSTARSTPDRNSGQQNYPKPAEQALPVHLAEQAESEQTEPRQVEREKDVPFLAVARSKRVNGSNGKH